MNPFAQNIISNKKIGIISHLNVSKFLAIHNTVVNAQFSIPKRNAGFLKNVFKKI